VLEREEAEEGGSRGVSTRSMDTDDPARLARAVIMVKRWDLGASRREMIVRRFRTGFSLQLFSFPGFGALAAGWSKGLSRSPRKSDDVVNLVIHQLEF